MKYISKNRDCKFKSRSNSFNVSSGLQVLEMTYYPVALFFKY